MVVPKACLVPILDFCKNSVLPFLIPICPDSVSAIARQDMLFAYGSRASAMMSIGHSHLFDHLFSLTGCPVSCPALLAAGDADAR